MDWQDSKIFLAVVTGGSFSSAARTLGITHPTVSRRVSRLEKTLDTRLFDRTPKGLEITIAGQELLTHVENMARAAAAITTFGNKETRQPKGIVRISCGSPVHSYITCHLDSFFEQFPLLRLELDDSTRHLDLARSEADIVIRRQLPDRPALITRKLVEFDMSIYASPAYLDKHPFIKTAPFAGHSWIAHDDEMAEAPHMQWLYKHVGEPAMRLRYHRRHDIINATKFGLGLSLLPDLWAEPNRDLVAVSDPIPELRTKLHIIAHRDILAQNKIRAVWNWLVELMR
ncbi:MAG: LysR family transcriptional regulator [Cohaesibacteraceae bacterium]|nr:LysR family transcriptional regulator [Cohaesibacteraceae bacterium]